MSNWAKGTQSYQEAVAATAETDEPAVGFIKATSSNIGPQTGVINIIRQHNTIIQLLVVIAEKLEELTDQFKEVKKQVKEVSLRTDPFPEGTLKRLEALSLEGASTSKRRSEVKGRLRVFEDPKEIYKREVKKISSKSK